MDVSGLFGGSVSVLWFMFIHSHPGQYLTPHSLPLLQISKISGLGQVVWNKKCIFNIPKYTRLLRPCLFQGIAGIPHHGLGFLSPSGSSLYNPDVLVLSLSAFFLSAFSLPLSPYLTNTALLSSICMATSLTRLWDWWTCLRAPPRLKPTFIL